MSDRRPGRTTVTTAADGTQIERTETSNPDGSTTIIRKVTSPSGGATIEMESYPRGALPPRLVKMEESSTTEEGGVMLVTRTAFYSDGSKEIVRERKHPSGATEVATERAQVDEERPALSEHGNGGATAVWDVEEPEISENPQPLASTRSPSASRSRDEETKDEQVSAVEEDVIVPTATLVPDMVEAETAEIGETLAPDLPTVSSRNQDMPGTVVQEDVNAEQVSHIYDQASRRFCRCSKKKAVAGALVLMALAGVGIALWVFIGVY